MLDIAPPLSEPPVEQPRLYKSREPIFPKPVSGRFRRFKWAVLIAALAIYYITPWIRLDRGPFAPDQAVLIDLAARRFYFFWIEIWPQEFYYITGLLVMAGMGLFLVTSAVGRAWCGYACPQTVWTDLFMWVERRIDGDRNAQIRLHAAPWTADKLRRRVAKHAIWLLIAMATGGAWVFYFADAPTLLGQLFTGQADSVAYITIAVLTFTTYSLAGLMREQVCIYMCPWPRIQGAMLDANSLTVTYNDWRGEPRARHRKKLVEQGVPAGDCIDCNACVSVCPMGIDIRDGQQLECITCALCIDACDTVMDRVGLARGLISYSTFDDYAANVAGTPTGVPVIRRLLRPRTLIYLAVWAGVGLAMLAVLVSRDQLAMNVAHDRNPLYTLLSSGDIRDGYTVKVLNMQAQPRRFRLRLDHFPEARLTLPGIADAPATSAEFEVKPDQLREIRLLVTAPPADEERRPFDLVLEEIGGNLETARVGAVFHSPDREDD